MDRRASQRLFGVDLSGAEAGIVEIQAIEDLVVVVARRGDWVARELPGVGALEEQDRGRWVRFRVPVSRSMQSLPGLSNQRQIDGGSSPFEGYAATPPLTLK